jgi:hypothetical protein
MRWLAAWACYWLGYVVFLACDRLDLFETRGIGWALWQAYQRPMQWSYDIQGETKLGPWRFPEEGS